MKAALFLRIRWVCMCISAVVLTPRGSAQGYIIFNNRIPGQLIAPIFGGEPGNPGVLLRGNPTNGLPLGTTLYHGPLLEGTNFTAELWAGPAGTPENELIPVAATTFLTGSLAGFVQPPANPVVIPSVPAGAVATLQWRVWKNIGGSVPTWQSMMVAGSVPRGVSDPFTSPPLGSTPASAPSPPGLRSFNITCLSCGVRPAIFALMQDVNGSPGETISFRVDSVGELPVTYQWFFNGVPLSNSPSISQSISGSGVVSLSLIISNLQPSHTGQYSLWASNDFGATLSPIAALAVFPPPFLYSSRLTTEGKFSLVLTGAPQRRYSLEASSDLSSWLPHATLTNQSGQVSFTESNPASDATKFFRARLLPLP